MRLLDSNSEVIVVIHLSRNNDKESQQLKQIVRLSAYYVKKCSRISIHIPWLSNE